MRRRQDGGDAETGAFPMENGVDECQATLAWDVFLPVYEEQRSDRLHVRLTSSLRDAIRSRRLRAGSSPPPSAAPPGRSWPPARRRGMAGAGPEPARAPSPGSVEEHHMAPRGGPALGVHEHLVPVLQHDGAVVRVADPAPGEDARVPHHLLPRVAGARALGQALVAGPAEAPRVSPAHVDDLSPAPVRELHDVRLAVA